MMMKTFVLQGTFAHKVACILFFAQLVPFLIKMASQMCQAAFHVQKDTSVIQLP